jgi:tRNA pseudouridine13 synthase
MARVTQTFSLWLPHEDEATVAERIQEGLPVEIHWAKRHRNKIKTGHLIGNAFRILVVQTDQEAAERAGVIEEALLERGVPNFYGAQRFGIGGDNAAQGRAILVRRKRARDWTGRFLLSAFLSSLFNDWLAERMRLGWFERLLSGDIAKKTDTGGLFEVEDALVEEPRFRRGEITYTGPIYGYKMRWATGEPGALEREVLEDSGVTEEMLHRAGLRGSRRRARLLTEDLAVEPDPQGLRFAFTLPKGAYATIVLREFMKLDEESGEGQQAKKSGPK